MNSKQQQFLDHLPSWIEKFKLQYGLVIDENGIREGNLQSFRFSSSPEINKIDQTNSIKTKLTITNSLLKSYLLKNGIDDIDERMNFFDQEVPFINSKVKDLWNSESKQKAKQTIHYEINSQQIELTFENFVPSNELIKVVREALDTENPYHELEIIFNEYGHLLCKKVILGGQLSRLWYLNENILPEEIIKKRSINGNEELDEILKDWDETHKKINLDLDLYDKYFFNIDGNITKRNLVIEWIKTIPENLESWDVIYYADLIPLYKIFDEPLQKEIELLSKDQILMMNSIKIEDRDKNYYRVKFKTPLKSNEYQIYGTIFNNNSERCSDIIIKFKYFNQYGFSTIIERCNNNQNDTSHIQWVMVGSPVKIGFYSKDTRKLEMISNEKASGADLGDIIDISLLNSSFIMFDGDCGVSNGKLKIIQSVKNC